LVTIYDIAKKTGYSPPTVSKALNGTGGLSARTRELILTTAHEMGYTPNMTARSLTTNRSNLIGVIYEDYSMLKGFKHPLFSEILNSFRKAIEAAGYDLLFLSRTLGPRQMSYLEHCEYRNVDGILIMNPVPGDQEVARLVASGRPCVSANEPFSGICTVVTANVDGAREAVEYLISLGHRSIAYVSGPQDVTAPASMERERGYRECLVANGVEPDAGLTEVAEFWHAPAGYEAAKKLIARRRDFTAVLASNDTLAYGTKLALEESGLSVPGDVSLIGFDGDDLGQYMSPKLTTMWQNAEEIGVTAAHQILLRLAGEDLPEIIRVPARLLVRESCAQVRSGR